MAVPMRASAADYLNRKLDLGLTMTSLIKSGVLALALVWQLAQKRYVPAPCWLSVVLISIVATLITDNLVDGLQVRLLDSAIISAGALAATLVLWYRSKGTLSIHSIFTNIRKACYWLMLRVKPELEFPSKLPTYQAHPNRNTFQIIEKAWQELGDSNPRPSVLETDALPTELNSCA